VATPEGGANIVKTAVDSFGKVDIVINNAGFLRDKSFLKLTWDDLDAILDVHLKAAFYVSQPAFAVMKENGYGRFVFTASNATFGNFGQTNYSAAKMGLVGLSNTIAVEGARAGILSNVIMPVAKTRMTEELLGEFANYLAPEFVTPMVAYLCSEACTTTHGAYSAAGGRYAKVFWGLAQGWYAGQEGTPTAEDIASHLAEIEKEAPSSRAMPPMVKATITSSSGYCDERAREAGTALSAFRRTARSWASTTPSTCPRTMASTCTTLIVRGETAVRSTWLPAVPNQFAPVPNGSLARIQVSWPSSSSSEK
jgi:NAD(P)-dependent dehydrogenase (short-subunit alcohol dehydrogenase family)